MISSVFATDGDTASSDAAMSDRELFASECLNLGTILANLDCREHKIRFGVPKFLGQCTVS